MFQITLKAARVNAGLTQTEVAKAIGKAKCTLCGWERGKGTIDIKNIWERRAAVRAWQEKKYLCHVRNVFEVTAFVIGAVGWILFLSYTFVVAAFG